MFDRLGITEAMEAKMKAQPTPAEVVAVVAKGEADLALFLINVLIAPGLDVVSPSGRRAAERGVHGRACSKQRKAMPQKR